MEAPCLEEQSMKLANLEKAYELAPEFKGKMKVGSGPCHCSGGKATLGSIVDWHEILNGID